MWCPINGCGLHYLCVGRMGLRKDSSMSREEREQEGEEEPEIEESLYADHDKEESKPPGIGNRNTPPKHESTGGSLEDEQISGVINRLKTTEDSESIEICGKQFNERTFFKLSKEHSLEDLLKDFI